MRDDFLIFEPGDVDLARSPLRGKCEAETFVLGAFNPGFTRLPLGNLMMMVRVAEGLVDAGTRSLRWEADRYLVDEWPADRVDATDPRILKITGDPWRPLALTSLSWLLPVELSPDGERVEAVHYDRAIVPAASYQAYGVEDPRISKVGDEWVMTTCSVSPERLCTTLYRSRDAIDWTLEGIVLDHQNKDMLVFEGQSGGRYWAQTRPLGETWFAYPPGSEWRAGPAINLATSPDLLHWKPYDKPGLRPHAATVSTARMGGGTPPILTDCGWLTLWHGVEPGAEVGIYRTYWSILDRDDPSITVATEHEALIEPAPHLTAHLDHLKYLDSVVFTTGIVDAGDHYLVASGEADLACRLTRIDKGRFA
ncbi:glycosidase [uncultured Sphingomonas sp.]|uniref:glycoside hydrolase family 130 protein n=1 Tax=uncultured Sphingomonas sp. TaxID=158754 RepID=UPI0025F09E8D|nr:glycosidase [uncultured Sphingomonas sp.]